MPSRKKVKDASSKDQKMDVNQFMDEESPSPQQ